MLVQFGDFEFRADIQELRKHGLPIKVQPKPLLVLRALIETPGELVSRETLIRRLWPDGTFVDFESGLNTATNRLRTALGDSAERPVYIQTVSRLGYRFICPVEFVETSDVDTERDNVPVQTEDASTVAANLNAGLIARLKSKASRPRNYLVLVLVVVLVAFLILAHSTGLVSWSQAHFSFHYFSKLSSVLSGSHIRCVESAQMVLQGLASWTHSAGM
jgi:DNA-binding winged helix-turn-helix (wHTH) protein